MCQHHDFDQTRTHRPFWGKICLRPVSSIAFQYRMLVTLADHNVLRLDLPELKLFLVRVLGQNLHINLVSVVSSCKFPTKINPKKGQKIMIFRVINHFHGTVGWNAWNFIYQLFVLNKKALLQFFCRRPLEAVFWGHIFGSVFHTRHSYHLTVVWHQLWPHFEISFD